MPKLPGRAHLREAPDEGCGLLVAGGVVDHRFGQIVEGDGELAVRLLRKSVKTFKHRRPVQIHGVAFPDDVGRQVEVEAVGGKQPKQAVSDVVAGDEHDRGLDPGLGESRLLEADGVRIVDLEIGDARRLLAHAAGVEAGAEDDDLPAAVAELRIEVIVVIARPELDALPARRKARTLCAPPPAASAR